MKKIAVCGTRDFDVEETKALLVAMWPLVVHTFGEVSMIVTGCAKGGADAAARDVAGELTGRFALVFKADWEKDGKAAGPIRNTKIADTSDGLVLIWDEKSPGSKDVKSKFDRLKRPVMEVIP